MSQDGGSVLYFEWDALQEELVLAPCICHALSFVKVLIMPVAKCSEEAKLCSDLAEELGS